MASHSWRVLLALPFSFDLAACRITGFHVDDESCSVLIQNNKTDQIIKCAKFFESLSSFSTSLKPHGMQLVADAGTGWTCDFGQSGCFDLTFGGKTAPVAHHVMDLTDGVVLMDYDTDSERFLQRAAPYLRYGVEQGSAKQGAVRVGAAVVPWGEEPAWWQTKDEAALEALLAAAHESLQKHTSFGGYAVFHYSTLRNTSLLHPCDGCVHQPKDLWYMDHGIVLDEERWPEWFQWAQERRVTGLYIAPHAGSQSLIEIPGVEGSKQDEATFCRFVQRCEQSSIRIELLSGGDWAVRYDLPFALNCAAQSLVV